MTAPFLGGDLPDFSSKTSADVVLFFDSDYTHAAHFGDAPRPVIGYGFWNAKRGEAEIVEPEIGDRGDGFGHQAPALPRNSEPEAAVVGDVVEETDRSNDLFGGGPEAQCPMPLFSALHGRQSDVAVVGQGAVGGIRPWNVVGQELDDSPMREDALGLFCVCQFERTQEEPGGFESRSHGSIVTSCLNHNGDPKVSVVVVVCC